MGKAGLIELQPRADKWADAIVESLSPGRWHPREEGLGVAVSAQKTAALCARRKPVTLLELVMAVTEVTDDERETLATVLHLLRSGRVKLRGTFRDEPIDSWKP